MAAENRLSPGDPFESLVAGALAGERAAWDALVARLERVVWKAVNMMTTEREVRDDAFAATWLRLAERLDTIREPEKLPGWLTTTATNEVRQILRQRHRHDRSLTESWSSEGGVGDLIEHLTGDHGEHSEAMVVEEDRRAVRDAFGRLDPSCREILTVLVLADPPVPYDVAGDLLDRPVGSLGPTRRRCLDKLRTLLDHTPGGLT